VSLFDRVRRVRTVLAVGVLARALGWAAFTALTVILATALVDRYAGLGAGVRNAVLLVAGAGAAATFAALGWRDRSVFSLERVALWIEEQQPSLQFTLISALELRDERVVRADQPPAWPSLARRRAMRGMRASIAAVIIASLVVMVLPAGAVARLRSPRAGDALDRASNRPASASRLEPLIARITPPAYSHLEPTALDEPSDVRALAGSTIAIEGRGSPDGIIGIAGADTLHAGASGDRWTIATRAGAAPATVRLVDREYQKLIVVEPTADAAPIVTLTRPARDSVLRQARGSLQLDADVSDDLGIASASFEYIVSSGEGENFTFKSGTIGVVKPNAPRASVKASLALATLGLKPGDILHLRAVARDANDVTGPGIGTSDKRSIRIARADEYDSVAVEAAAPTESDKSFVSQRMLITLAEALEKRRPRLAKDTLVRESRAIGVDQRRLRGTVSEILFGKADSVVNVSTDVIDIDDESDPGIAVNKPLLEAYNARWDASTQLEIGEPGKALPHMRRALAAIERARRAQRIYLRGRPPQVVLDLSKVRLKGKDKGSPSTRLPVAPIDAAQHALGERFLRIVDLAERNAGAAADSLLVLRIDALSRNADLAAALGDAASAIRRNRANEATAGLIRARRALSGAPIARDSIARWGIVP
jgi:hypothetical protein